MSIQSYSSTRAIEAQFHSILSVAIRAHALLDGQSGKPRNFLRIGALVAVGGEELITATSGGAISQHIAKDFFTVILAPHITNPGLPDL
ncbi:hypothetical protein CDAR_84311 [Caerostris darwini]|uniref:Uncharacterized protein n=1 Tax=Caerostris darwini TaxID=1538125 RepID=A0AAV4X110_9ARAC|nr:hypothetical protein CDAR_84311 [Caerostris darwini]